MKAIKRTARFDRHYKERIAKNNVLLSEFIDAIDSFLLDPTLVNDHSLKGKMSYHRSFSINQDYRVIYMDKEDHFLFKDIGTHKQIYKE